MEMRSYEVYHQGKWLDTYFTTETDIKAIKQSLVNHDGYPSDIKVVAKKKKMKRFRANPNVVDYFDNSTEI